MTPSEGERPMTESEIAGCLERARAGDENAVSQLFHYMYPQVVKLVYANLPPREQAEDLVQKVCIKAVTHLHQFSGKVPFLHWISRIAVNTCLNQIRHEKHRPELRFGDLPRKRPASSNNWPRARTTSTPPTRYRRGTWSKSCSRGSSRPTGCWCD